MSDESSLDGDEASLTGDERLLDGDEASLTGDEALLTSDEALLVSAKRYFLRKLFTLKRLLSSLTGKFDALFGHLKEKLSVKNFLQMFQVNQDISK